MIHGWHLVEHIKNKRLRSDNTLHVVTVISNPAMYRRRYALARKFIEEMNKTENVQLHVVETAFGDRHHEIVSASPHHLALRTKSEIWIKENMINLGVKHLLPRDWKYFAWIDADVFFRNEGWAQDAIHQLQHYPVIQPWQSAVNLGPTGNVSRSFDSVGWKQARGIDPKYKYSGDPYKFGHTGYGWACTREFYEAVGGLMDFSILGSADHHMALAMRGIVKSSINMNIGGAFVRRCEEWQTKALRLTHGNVGYCDGRVEHFFHGPMTRRYYRDRWQILIANKFDPDQDLTYDAQGLIQLIGKPALEHAIRMYNRSRFEDSIEEY